MRGANGGPWTVDFINDLANLNVSQLVPNNVNADVTTDTQGAAIGSAADQIANASAVTVAKSGQINFGTRVDNVGVTTVDGGRITGANSIAPAPNGAYVLCPEKAR